MNAMHVRVEAPQVLNLDGFIHVSRDIDVALERGAREILVDLGPVLRAYPDGVLPLVAALMRLRWSEHVDVGVRFPTSAQLKGVFDGVGWTHHLSASRAEFRELPPITRQFTPATPFTTSEELERVRKSIMQVVLAQPNLARWLPEAIEWSLWEVMENVLNHSGLGLGWVQASSFRESRHINIAVVDGGVGIRESLSGRYEGLTHQESLRKAVEEGGTRDPNRNAGYGLTGCARIALANRGELTVYSGNYILRVQAGSSRQGDFYRYSRAEPDLQGTLVELELRMDREIDPKIAFKNRPTPLIDLQPGQGEEFLFLVVEEAANVGTRSAGRELRNRIKNLRQSQSDGRIVLDFSGLPMLSSSFADELVARLAEEIGTDQFFKHFELRGMSEPVETIVQTTLWSRLR
jgi:hypothetical protein